MIETKYTTAHWRWTNDWHEQWEGTTKNPLWLPNKQGKSGKLYWEYSLIYFLFF